MKFSLEWLADFVDAAAAGGPSGVRAQLDRAGFPVESVEGESSATVFDVEITPNRPDAMSHRGLAREIAAMAGIPLLLPLPAGEGRGEGRAEAAAGPSVDELASVAIEVPRLCRRFGARVVRGIRSAPSSPQVRSRLEAIGSNPISAAVDATNYVLWEIGQPLHAFDLDKLAGSRIVVRKARRGEKLVTLDGIERTLDPSDVVVADAERAVSLAGVMGGLDTAVTASTKNVLLEAAWWDPPSIRRTSRRLGLHTDASHRFERGADPEAIPESLARAAAILLASAGGSLAEGWIDARGTPWKTRRARLRLSRLRLLAGDGRLDLDFAAQALERLGFRVERRGRALAAAIPSFRPDVTIEDDLVEEVLRINGYDRLASRLPPAGRAGGHLEPLRVVEERLTDGAVAAGLYETMSPPFVDRRGDEGALAAWLSEIGSSSTPVSLANPLDAGRRDLRATLLPGLLDAVARNVHRGQRDVGLFEVGRVFDRPGDPDDPPSFESRRIAFALAGAPRSHWSTPAAAARADFFDAKGVAEKLLSPWIPAGSLSWKPFSCGAFAEGACALVQTAAEGKTLGIAGLVSRPERERRKLAEDVFAAELCVEAIPAAPAARFEPYSSYPPIEADLSFAQEKKTLWREIEAAVAAAKLSALESVRVVDRYEGPGVPAGRVKTTIRLVFRSHERTLEQEEVNREVHRLAEELKSKLGVTFGSDLSS